MSEPESHNTTGQFALSSSIEDCRWHDLQGQQAFERWHFDALSDDGREALVITFHDNCAFSPRYFQQGSRNGNSLGHTQKLPSVSLIYAVDGRPVLRTVNEFTQEHFSAGSEGVSCSIGESSFHINAASYGRGFVLNVDLLTTWNRRIKAELEWLSIESDLSPEAAEEENQEIDACWNIAAPRSDVSGRITLYGPQGTTRRLLHFRGTGYHDHIRSSRSLTEAIGSRYWGRVHFADSTAIFNCHDHGGRLQPYAKLLLIRDGVIDQREISNIDRFIKPSHAFKGPGLLTFIPDDEIMFRIKPISVFQSGFFERKALCEMTLDLPDGKPRKAIGITELLTPELMRSRLIRWLADLRIGKNGKCPVY